MEVLLQVTFLFINSNNSIDKISKYPSLAVGEIDMDGNSLRLQSSSTGPMLLTTATKNTLIKKFEEAKSSMM